MYVLLECRDCRRYTRVPADSKSWGPCRFCGGTEYVVRLEVGSERVDRAYDDDAWKNSLDEYLTNDRRRV